MMQFYPLLVLGAGRGVNIPKRPLWKKHQYESFIKLSIIGRKNQLYSRVSPANLNQLEEQIVFSKIQKSTKIVCCNIQTQPFSVV